MNNLPSETKMRRRSFFRTVLGAVAAVGGGSVFLGRFVPTSFRIAEKSKLTVRINPLAVPRTRKGENANG